MSVFSCRFPKKKIALFDYVPTQRVGGGGSGSAGQKSQSREPHNLNVTLFSRPASIFIPGVRGSLPRGHVSVRVWRGCVRLHGCVQHKAAQHGPQVFVTQLSLSSIAQVFSLVRSDDAIFRSDAKNKQVNFFSFFAVSCTTGTQMKCTCRVPTQCIGSASPR